MLGDRDAPHTGEAEGPRLVLDEHPHPAHEVAAAVGRRHHRHAPLGDAGEAGTLQGVVADDLAVGTDRDRRRELTVLVEGHDALGVVAVDVEVRVAVVAVDDPGHAERVVGTEPTDLVLLVGGEGHALVVVDGCVGPRVELDLRRRPALHQPQLLALGPVVDPLGAVDRGPHLRQAVTGSDRASHRGGPGVERETLVAYAEHQAGGVDVADHGHGAVLARFVGVFDDVLASLGSRFDDGDRIVGVEAGQAGELFEERTGDGQRGPVVRERQLGVERARHRHWRRVTPSIKSVRRRRSGARAGGARAAGSRGPHRSGAGPTRRARELSSTP